MQNKRGISQAFVHQPSAQSLRRATVFDVFEISRVLIRSIRELCHADHQGDPARLQSWTQKKTPADIQNWITEGAEIWVIERDGRLAAVGALGAVTAQVGEVTLNYVSPDFRGQGISSHMLQHLEHRLVERGARRGRLEATDTAWAFYLARGWEPAAAQCGDRIECRAMAKSLVDDGEAT